MFLAENVLLSIRKIYLAFKSTGTSFFLEVHSKEQGQWTQVTVR